MIINLYTYTNTYIHLITPNIRFEMTKADLCYNITISGKSIKTNDLKFLDFQIQFYFLTEHLKEYQSYLHDWRLL